MGLPDIVTREEWLAAREELLVKEKAATRERDALNAERRRLPMVEITKEYLFDGSDGKATLFDLFDGHAQLIVYHFMFAPEWDTGCRSCSAFIDQIGHLAHLRSRGTTFVAVSRAPFTKILPFKARMGWTVPWYSSNADDFNRDFHATVYDGRDPADQPGLSCFLRDGDRVFHTYSTFNRGTDGVASYSTLFDLTALGRQEEWEEPKGRSAGLGAPAGSRRLRYHDEYEE
ncbi:DUF899 domain-containing protein [Streptomyces sp. NPDC048441]|uniref:DUF899 domain-containing protein n=1 Tax=Streptomyces sp. NPDC048441 TaxID=3365552 RepID=UPI00371A2E03